MATGNPWYSAAEISLPQYVPLPFQELMAAGQAIQNRYDTNMAAMDSTAQGIASIETRLPAHQRYVADFANRFQEETSDLLSKYNNNAADPQFAREFTRLRSRYANDPNLRTILNANATYDSNQKIRQKLMESGQRFIDTTGSATGIDEQGRLTSNVGTIRATNFESDLHDIYQDTLKATINDFGGKISNEEAVGMVTESLLSEGANNPVLREAMEYFMSQGASPEKAQEQLLRTLQREAASALTIDRDGAYYSNQLGWANHGLARQRFNFDQAKEIAKQDRAGALVGLSSPLEVENLNKNLIKNVEGLLKDVDNSGELKTSSITVPATPENLVKYRGVPGVTSGIAGTSGQAVLRIPGGQEKDPEQIAQLESMRTELGTILDSKYPNVANDRQVLETYKEYLEADNNAPTFWASPVKEIRENITRMYIGNNGEHLHDAVIMDRKGNSTRVASDKRALEGLKGFDFVGITTSPVRGAGAGLEGGALKGTAVDGNGNIVTIYKPLPPGLGQAVSTSSTIDRAITSGVNNETLRKDPSFRVLSQNIVPQKRNGRIQLFEVDSNGELVGEPFSTEQLNNIIQMEKANISRYFSLHQNTD